jgi:hypothetical protein
MAAYSVPPTQKPVVRGHQSRILKDRRRGDESIRGIGVKALKLAGEDRDVASER